VTSSVTSSITPTAFGGGSIFQQHRTRATSATPIHAHSRAMSDSEESMSLPSDDKIEQTLRDTVANLFASGKSEEITVKRVRTIVEEKLGLPQDFLKSQDWKARSNTIIHDEVVGWPSISCCPPFGITDHLHSGPALCGRRFVKPGQKTHLAQEGRAKSLFYKTQAGAKEDETSSRRATRSEKTLTGAPSETQEA